MNININEKDIKHATISDNVKGMLGDLCEGLPSRGVCEQLDIDDVNPIEVHIPELTTDKSDPINDAITDYEYIRLQSVKNIATCDAILQHALSTLSCESSPRYIESCAGIIDTSMKCSKSLIEIHEKLKKLRAKDTPDENETAINKFVGSVSDVVKEITKARDS